jgi:hypothetical protein
MKHLLRLDDEKKVDIEMIGVSECMEETTCESSCSTDVITTTRGYLVGSNRTSLLAVDTKTEAFCGCLPGAMHLSHWKNPCDSNPCKNGGTCKQIGGGDFMCECPAEYEGPQCELLDVAFAGEGYALMTSLPACNDTEIRLAVLTDIEDAVLIYNGPIDATPYNGKLRKDLFVLELRQGRPVMLINFGGKTGYMDTKSRAGKINDGNWHEIVVRWVPQVSPLIS